MGDEMNAEQMRLLDTAVAKALEWPAWSVGPPRYSTDDAAALSLVRALVPSRFGFELTVTSNGYWHVWLLPHDPRSEPFEESSPSFAEAITLAAHQALYGCRFVCGLEVPE